MKYFNCVRVSVCKTEFCSNSPGKYILARVHDCLDIVCTLFLFLFLS